MSSIERIRPDRLFNSPGYTHAVAARGERTVYVSGQVAQDAAGKVVGVGDLAAQAAQVMENLATALAAAGATFDDVVKLTTYVVGYRPEHLAVIAEARGRHLTEGRRPAATLVGVSALAAPEYLIEVEAVAVTG